MAKLRRLNIRVTEEMSRQLERAAQTHGVTMTAIIESALGRYFGAPGQEDPGDLLLRRLDLMDRRQAAMERDMAITLETLQHYVLYWLTLTEPVAEGERDGAQALGRRRYDHFAAQVARRLRG